MWMEVWIAMVSYCYLNVPNEQDFGVVCCCAFTLPYVEKSLRIVSCYSYFNYYLYVVSVSGRKRSTTRTTDTKINF